MKYSILISALLLMGSQSALAMEGMDHSKMNHDSMDHSKMNHEAMNHETIHADNKAFLVKKEVEGYTVSFHVMQAAGDMKHGGSHNLMVQIEKDGEVINDALINSKVFFPNNASESKMLMLMDGWYMAGYDMDHQGRYGIMVLFKTADGIKHKASVYYPE